MAPKLITMLTYNDETVDDALSSFRECAGLVCDFWGFKDVGLLEDRRNNCNYAVLMFRSVHFQESGFRVPVRGFYQPGNRTLGHVRKRWRFLCSALGDRPPPRLFPIYKGPALRPF